MTESATDHWSDYWSLGCLTSLPQDFAANYDGEVRAFWNARFEEIPTAGNIVDLCTGNGAIALLAAGFSRGHGRAFQVTAVDAATMRPDVIAARFPDQAELLANIRFISGTRVESLDLPGEFDLVTSQYGLEYCNHQGAAKAVDRLLKPGGHLAMVCHSAGSDILAFMRKEHEEYALLEKLGLLESIEDYLDGDAPHSEFATALQSAQARLYTEFRATGSALYRSVLETVGGILSLTPERLKKSVSHLRAFHDQVLNGKHRLQDMLRVNQELIDDPGWVRVFEAVGLEKLDTGEIRYQGRHHAGNYFIFAKPVSRAC